MKKYNIPIPSIAGMDDLWYAAVLNGVLQPHDMEQGETKIPRPASAAESGGGTEEANTGETGNTNTDGDAGGRQAEVADPEPGKAHSNTENADTGSGAGSKKSEVSDPEPAHNNADSANSNGESGKGTGTPEPVHVGGGGTTVVFEKDNQPLVDGLGKVADTINASANSTINAIGRVEQTNIEGDARISGDIQKINGQTNENLEKIVDNTAELNNGGTPPFNFNDPKNNREAAVIIADAVRKAVPPSSK
jgi:hypothetical protein